VAIDTSDTLGLTAYVTIIGFHVSHVWKTSDGGGSWTDFTANLPDAPANAVLVDSGPTPDTGTVYVATDVGVFSSGTASANWTETGPAPDSGQAGYLPNVAVTALRMFNTGRTKKLRASTYGRGMWEFNLITIPDFQIGFTSSTLTAFVPQNATFNGTLTAFNGYSSQVTLSCTTGVPSLPNPCTPNPSKVTPLPAGKGFTVTAGGAVGDYSFDLHGAGSDTDLVTHDASLTLHVVDFGLTAPIPASVTVNVPNASQPVSFQATAKGSFHGTVNLSCTGLPADAACDFSPSSSVNPTSSSPVAVTLTISTSVRTPSGAFPLTISATTSGAPSPRTQDLTLIVTDGPDYTLTISNSSQSASTNASATFNGTLTSFKGYSSTVNLSCSAGAPPTCTASPVKPTPSGTPFTVTTSSNAVRTYSFNVVGQGTDPSKITHSAAVSFSSTFDFSITNKSSPPTISAGQSATYNLDVKPLGSNFPSSVALSFSACPARSTCSFDKAQIAVGGGDTQIAFNIRTTAPIVSSSRSNRRNSLPLYGIWLPLSGLALIFSGLRRCGPGRTRLAFLLLLSLALLIGVQVACGGGGGGNGSDVRGGQIGTPPGTYHVTVTATSGALTHNVLVTLTVQ
jgi:hypothetical protein